MSTKLSIGRVRATYEFIKAHKHQFSVQIYRNREGVSADVVDYIETFYNRTRRHSHLGGVSPEQFETAHMRRSQGIH